MENEIEKSYWYRKLVESSRALPCSGKTAKVVHTCKVSEEIMWKMKGENLEKSSNLLTFSAVKMERRAFSSSLKQDYVERIKWWKIGFSLPAEVTFQRTPGHLNTPLSRRCPSAGDGVSLRNDKGKLALICLHLFPLPQSLCYYRGGPLFPFISLYYVLFGLRDLWISSLCSHCWETLGFDVSGCCICASALCKTNNVLWEFLLELKLNMEGSFRLRQQRTNTSCLVTGTACLCFVFECKLVAI